MLLGAIADDLTGATDLALMLTLEGMPTVQTVGVPEEAMEFGDAQAVVIALKSRTISAADAVSQSVAAARALQAIGIRQLIFKYCSTFDSTPAGNIGPVIEALLDLLDERFTIACPAFPTNKRTVYRGHLFVGDQLLSDSPMKDHPLTPMRDANLVHVLQAQTRRPVCLVDYDTVRRGAHAIATAFRDNSVTGSRIAIVDAITDEDLREIGRAAATMRLITGGSGISIGLPDNFRKAQMLLDKATAEFVAPPGKAVMLAGSCSAATRRQVAVAREKGTPCFRLDPLSVDAGDTTGDDVLRWIEHASTIPLVYSSEEPAEVRRAQSILGVERAGEIVEHFLALLATRLRDAGYRRFLVAGGETSGAVVNALGVKALRIGPEIDPGVPWTRSLDDLNAVALALKSGNFGADDFFLKAWERLS
jgi:3-dehydrotetronate 4-kinase